MEIIMNKEYANELMERYLYDVVKRLPEKQRQDIKEELKSLIFDMLEERTKGAAPTEKDMEIVLLELGNPADLARKYRGEEKYLIGGAYYDQYCFLLKIVLVCTGVGMAIASIVTSFISYDAIPFWSIPSVLINVFGWLTIAFILIERYQVKIDMGISSWSPNKLPQIPNKKANISRVESAAGIVFNILFAILLCFAPHLIGAWFKNGEEMLTLAVFNLEIWNSIRPFFLVSFSLGILCGIVKLIVGRYTVGVAVTTVVTGSFSLIILIIVFKFFPIWNPEFALRLQQATGKVFESGFDLLTYWNTALFSNIIILIAFVGFIVDSIKAIYCAARFDK
ncbi:MAG TPA: hypothetical protein VJZ04_10755 [Lachnospiraceae bacterium]|nr:hypothetical protein [Lachnospiraceae bacterium]